MNANLTEIEVLSAFIIFGLLFGFANELKKIKYYILFSLVNFIAILVFKLILKTSCIFFWAPTSFLVLYQILRWLFKLRLKREPIAAFKGVILNIQEKKTISFFDYIFSGLLLVVPLIIQFIKIF